VFDVGGGDAAAAAAVLAWELLRVDGVLLIIPRDAASVKVGACASCCCCCLTTCCLTPLCCSCCKPCSTSWSTPQNQATSAAQQQVRPLHPQPRHRLLLRHLHHPQPPPPSKRSRICSGPRVVRRY
jgi:hypothetical protein